MRLTKLCEHCKYFKKTYCACQRNNICRECDMPIKVFLAERYGDEHD